MNPSARSITVRGQAIFRLQFQVSLNVESGRPRGMLDRREGVCPKGKYESTLGRVTQHRGDEARGRIDARFEGT